MKPFRTGPRGQSVSIEVVKTCAQRESVENEYR